MRWTSILMLIALMLEAKDWSLEECLQRADSLAFATQNALFTRQNDSLTLKKNRASFAPSLIGVAGSSANFPMQSYDSTFGTLSFGLQVDQTLFDGLRRGGNIKLNRTTLTGDSISIVSIKEDVAIMVMARYLSYQVSLKNSVTLLEEELSAQRELAQIEALLTSGRATDYDRSQAKAQLLRIQRSLLEANSRKEQDKEALFVSIMYTPSADDTIPEVVVDSQWLPPRLCDDSLITSILARDPSLEAKRVAVQKAEQTIKVAKYDRIPTLTGGVNLSTGSTTLMDSAFNAQLQDRLDLTASLNLRIPIVDPRIIRTNIERAEISLAKAQLDLEEAIQQRRAEISALVRDGCTARENLVTARFLLTTEIQSLQLAEGLYTAGKLSFTDLEGARAKRRTAELAFTEAQAQALFAYGKIQIRRGLPLPNPSQELVP